MKDETTEKIIEAASALIAERGVWGMSIGEIAAQVGVSKGTMHYYFPTKQDLVAAAAKRSLKRISDSLFAWVDSVNSEEDPTAAVERLCDALLPEDSPLRVFIAVNGVVEPGSELETLLDSSMSEWNVMIEVGSMRMRADASSKMKRMSAAILPFLSGLAALNADSGYAKAAFTALIMG